MEKMEEKLRRLAPVLTDKELQEINGLFTAYTFRRSKTLERAAGNSISDLDAYRKAVQFYFPGAEIRMTMEIDVCPNRVQPAEPEAPVQKKQPKLLDLTDFL